MAVRYFVAPGKSLSTKRGPVDELEEVFLQDIPLATEAEQKKRIEELATGGTLVKGDKPPKDTAAEKAKSDALEKLKAEAKAAEEAAKAAREEADKAATAAKKATGAKKEQARQDADAADAAAIAAEQEAETLAAKLEALKG